MFAFASIVPELPRIRIVDVGASLVSGEEPFAPLLRSLDCEVIGFEPVEAELEKLRRAAQPNRTFLPYVVGDGTGRTFHECNEAVTSSLLEPDAGVADAFQMLGEFMRVVSRTDVATRRLDDIPEAAGADFLKLDVQGGELMVLEGAANLLRGVAVVHTEVEFVPLYKEQPLFADIDAFLRAQGFLFHRFQGIAGRTFKPLLYRKDMAAALSQSLWADAVFVRDFRTFESLEPALLMKLAAILHENYRSIDLAALALKAHDKLVGTAFGDAYLGGFSAPSQSSPAQ